HSRLGGNDRCAGSAGDRCLRPHARPPTAAVERGRDSCAAVLPRCGGGPLRLADCFLGADRRVPRGLRGVAFGGAYLRAAPLGGGGPDVSRGGHQLERTGVDRGSDSPLDPRLVALTGMIDPLGGGRFSRHEGAGNIVTPGRLLTSPGEMLTVINNTRENGSLDRRSTVQR